MEITCTVHPKRQINSTTYIVHEGREDGIEEGDVCAVVIDSDSVTGQVIEAGEKESVVQTKAKRLI